MITFCKALCQQASVDSMHLATPIWNGPRQLLLLYNLGDDHCDLCWTGGPKHGNPDLAKRLFLHLFSGIPSVRPKVEAE